MDAVIAARDLHKAFGHVRALDGLDLDVAAGEIHGFLGPNGAGKTTTLRVLLGLLKADRGSVTLLGGDPWADSANLHRRLAYVPGDVNLWPTLTGGEVIDLLGKLRGGLNVKRRDELIERFSLDSRKKCRTYSKGNRQKVAIIAALSCDVELLLLDEPTSGLDPLLEVVFQEVMKQARTQGKTVLLSSHILAQVEKLADRISIVRLGKVVQSGTLADMRHLTRTTVEVSTVDQLTGLEELTGVHDLVTSDGHVRFDVDGDHLDAVIKHLARFDIRALTSHPPTLEELMLRHYGSESS